ncbi:MAG: patatin-like phospholipase family protein [Acidobacteriota bacterium]|nr:patatin-like phospholipase family protein [Acidobacteriota bacterium]
MANEQPATPAAELVTTTRSAEDPEPQPAAVQQGIALCLSGGGYRAMLFHVGVIWRLNQLGYLPKLDRISSVSGGSITSGTLGAAWESLTFDAGGVATNLVEKLVGPIRALAGDTIDVGSVLLGMLPGITAASRVAEAYRKHLFGHRTLQDLPDRPRFVINATNVQSGVLWRFSKPYIWDWRVGKIENPDTELAIAVGASSAFPPVLSPVRLHFNDSDFVPGSGANLQHPPFTTEVVLADGGVYDNMGLETAWKHFDTILVSDAGKAMEFEEKPKTDWLEHSIRILDVIQNQVHALRCRELVAAYKAGQRKGAYWGIATDFADYKVATPLACPHEQTLQLAAWPTRLAAVPAEVQDRLINWGYAVCDAAIRAHLNTGLPVPAGFPYPAQGVG